jgi:lipopolysaccharide biosynthesis glycosyltransferase
MRAFCTRKYNSDFAVQITSKVDDSQQMAINFANNNLNGHTRFLEDYNSSKTRVAVTVGMMTTGYDCQDILNIACRGKIKYLSLEYNMTDYSFQYSLTSPNKLSCYFSLEQIGRALECSNLHYNGHKPWKKYCVNFDIWWEYYRKSPYFNEQFYFKFFYKKLDELDSLSLWKRIKILIRYFVYGRAK